VSIRTADQRLLSGDSPMIDETLPVPFHVQLSDILRARIQAGDWDYRPDRPGHPQSRRPDHSRARQGLLHRQEALTGPALVRAAEIPPDNGLAGAVLTEWQHA
jgi:hypothetical protein